MPDRIRAAVRNTGTVLGDNPAAITRCILDSLAAAFARAIDDAGRLSGRDIRTIHVVGGGANNELLCELTADACGRPVVAGPVEATAIGNILVQARTHGFVSGGLDSLRALVRATQPLRQFEPSSASTTSIPSVPSVQ